MAMQKSHTWVWLADPKTDQIFDSDEYNKVGNSDADGLPLVFWGLEGLIDAGAVFVYENMSEWLERFKGKAWIVRTPNGSRWHVQANWLVKSQPESTLSAVCLRAFSVLIPPNGDAPKVYEYGEGEEEAHIPLVGVDVRAVNDSRCLVSLAGMSGVLVSRAAAWLQMLYPVPNQNTEPAIVRRGKPGAKRKPLYDQAADQMRDGATKAEAWEWYMKQEGIVKPGKDASRQKRDEYEKSHEAFSSAMKQKFRLNPTN